MMSNDKTNQIVLETARAIGQIDPDQLPGKEIQAIAQAQCLIIDAIHKAPTAPAVEGRGVLSHDEYHQMAFEIGQPSENGEGYFFDCNELDEFVTALFSTRPHNGEQGGWISVDERLPEMTGHYSVALSDPDDIGWSTLVSWTAFWNGDDFEDCDPVEDGQPVTHWMPLPAPPTEREE